MPNRHLLALVDLLRFSAAMDTLDQWMDGSQEVGLFLGGGKITVKLTIPSEMRR